MFEGMGATMNLSTVNTLLLAQNDIDNDGDLSGFVWLIVGIMAIVALGVYIVRNIR